MSTSVSYDDAAPVGPGTGVATTTARRRRLIGNLVFLLVVTAAALWWATELRPQRLGGTADYVIVQGVSMLPTYRSGDLVLVKPASGYQVGDIVAYRVPAGDVGAGLTVIHRIVGGSPAQGFVTKGDNNAEVDDWHPKGSDIEGVPWRVVPQGGQILAFLHAPVPVAALAAAIAVMMFTYRSGNTSTRTTGRRRRKTPGGSGSDPAPEPAGGEDPGRIEGGP